MDPASTIATTARFWCTPIDLDMIDIRVASPPADQSPHGTLQLSRSKVLCQASYCEEQTSESRLGYGNIPSHEMCHTQAPGLSPD